MGEPLIGERPFRVGERVRVLGSPGEVIELTWHLGQVTHVNVRLDGGQVVRAPVITSLEPES